MNYIVYQTTNIVNDKIYIGVHMTLDINDEYLGSGKILVRAISKYGKEHFKKEILFIYDNKDDMFAKEKELVNESFIARIDTYNVKLGGSGGSLRGRIVSEKTRNRMSTAKKGVKQSLELIEKRKRSVIGNPKLKTNLGKRLSEETKRKIGEASKGRSVGLIRSEETKQKMKEAWVRRKATNLSVKPLDIMTASVCQDHHCSHWTQST